MNSALYHLQRLHVEICLMHVPFEKHLTAWLHGVHFKKKQDRYFG